MKKFFLLFILTSLLIVASVTANPDRTVGVSTGDWFKYEDITVTWSSNDPDASKVWYGMDLEMYNQTEWVKIEITGVSGTNVTMQGIQHFKNGTEEISDGWVDIDTGDSINASTTVIGANLNEGDPIYTAGDYYNWFINETIIRDYPGPDTPRGTNHINMTYTYQGTIPPDINVDYFYSINFYWDTATGVLVEDSFEMINQTGEYLTTWSIFFKISESNVWIVPEFPNLIVWLAVIGTATAVLVFGERRLSKNKSLIFK